MVECPLKIAVTDLSSSLMGQTFTQTRKDKVRAVLTTLIVLMIEQLVSLSCCFSSNISILLITSPESDISARPEDSTVIVFDHTWNCIFASVSVYF